MKRGKRAFLEKNFILIFRACGKANLPRKAIELFDRMVDEFQCKQTVKSFNSVLNVIIQQGLHHHALEFYDYVINKKKNISPNVLTFNLMIKALCKSGWVSRAVDLFREMPILKCDPDVFTYCTLMDGLCKDNRIEDAVALLDEMQIEGCSPTPATYNVLINGLCKKGDLARAAKLLDNMFLKGCTPNEVTYNTLIHGLCLKGKLDRAGRAVDGVHVLMAMEERGYRANEWERVIRQFFYGKMAEKDCKDNEVCYSVLIHGLCKDGKLKDALMIWKHVLAKGLTPDTVAYSSMIHGLCNAGSIEQGLDLFNEMLCKASNSRPDVITFNILINALCRQNRISHAIDILNSMLDLGCDPDSVTCKIFLKTLKEKVDPPQDDRLLSPVIRQLSEKYPHVTTYKIDIDKEGLENALSKLNIHSVPTLHFFQDGKKAS
ncbi:UNVERIFIED_CONTAM: Pentatricopeptide repeat-containing protein [Sesamum radiatum]|uniref:Pentatricopeptide repeat-containing protein n=1 Tax=Sesamum radiatum TaxID=300843 RepID=A0AAW2LQM9_SESRA